MAGGFTWGEFAAFGHSRQERTLSRRKAQPCERRMDWIFAKVGWGGLGLGGGMAERQVSIHRNGLSRWRGV